MNSYIKTILKFYQNQKNNNIYNDWINKNSIYYMKSYTILALAITALLIPFDFLLYENPIIYASARTILMSIYIVQLAIIFKFFKENNNILFNLTILIPPLSYNLMYSYFLLKADVTQSYYLILLLATFLVIIISSVWIYKFFKEQYILTLISISGLFLVSIYKPDISSDIIKLIIFHIISFGICIYYRYEFMMTLVNKYEYLSSLLPNKFAKLVSVSDDNLDINKLFPTKEYFSVCLCADWRNYQKITNTSSKDKVGEMIEQFYTIIYKELDKLNISGQYYADWTADELFIIFYGDEQEKDLIKFEALDFCHSLATTLYMEINTEINKNIMYDIGLSSGYGLIGLQGPSNFKKTTITGDVAGNSKRYETEAKKIRKNNNKKSFPIIVMDQDLSKKAYQLEKFKNNMKSAQIKGTTKDITGFDLTSWMFYKTDH